MISSEAVSSDLYKSIGLAHAVATRCVDAVAVIDGQKRDKEGWAAAWHSIYTKAQALKSEQYIPRNAAFYANLNAYAQMRLSELAPLFVEREFKDKLALQKNYNELLAAMKDMQMKDRKAFMIKHIIEFEVNTSKAQEKLLEDQWATNIKSLMIGPGLGSGTKH